jgi:hypothetical protein
MAVSPAAAALAALRTIPATGARAPMYTADFTAPGMAADMGGCSGSGSPFAGYAPAGLLTVGPLTAAGAQTFFGSVDITGADLPPGSVLVFDRAIGTNQQSIAQISSDGAPQAIGQGGIGFAISSLNNQNAPGVFLALNTTRTLEVGVRFGAGAAIGDTVVFQILSKGGRSVQNQVCGR